MSTPLDDRAVNLPRPSRAEGEAGKKKRRAKEEEERENEEEEGGYPPVPGVGSGEPGASSSAKIGTAGSKRKAPEPTASASAARPPKRAKSVGGGGGSSALIRPPRSQNDDKSLPPEMLASRPPGKHVFGCPFCGWHKGSATVRRKHDASAIHLQRVRASRRAAGEDVKDDPKGTGPGDSCSLCGVWVSANRSVHATRMRDHKWNVHDVGTAPDPSKCSQCEEEFEHGNLLATHVKAVHEALRYPCMEKNCPWAKGGLEQTAHASVHVAAGHWKRHHAKGATEEERHAEWLASPRPVPVPMYAMADKKLVVGRRPRLGK